MALNVSAWSIRHPIAPIVMATAIVAVGWINFLKLPITYTPNIDAPQVLVVITQFGTSPAELETQVTSKVEDAISSIAGIQHVTSAISDGISTTTIIFRLGTDTDRALNDVKDSIATVRADLPRSIDEPIVRRIDITGLPILTYAAIAPGKTPEQVSHFVDEVVVRELQGIRGVGSVERAGSVDREIRVGLDPVRLQGVGLTPLHVSRQLRGSNVDVAGGRAEIGGRNQAIRTLAGAKTLAELQATRIALPGGGEVRLDDLGLVADSIAEQRTFARFNGTPTVGISIIRAKGASDVAVAEAVAHRVKEINAANPAFEVKLIDTSVNYTLGNYHSALSTLYEGTALAIVVVFLFLRDWRATIIAAITLPLSIFPAFWVMQFLGFSLNIVSLLAITLSVGILVDDAIVEIENIERHMQQGKSAYRASIEAADEIGLAVIAISLTIIAVFLPASFMSSVPGQFFRQFGATVSVQVLFSLLVARFITPLLTAYFLVPRPHRAEKEGRLHHYYAATLDWSVRHRFLTVGLGVALFVLTLVAARNLPSEFMPQIDTARSVLAIELPPGSQLTETEAVAETISQRLRARPEVEGVYVDGGRIRPVTTDIRKAALTISYVPKSKRSMSQQKLEQAITQDLAGIPDIRYWFLDESGVRNVMLILTGEDSSVVASVAAELAAQMKRLPMVANVISTAALNRPELRIYPKRDLAVRLGVPTETLAEIIRVATIGDVAPALPKFDAGDRTVPIRVLLEEKARADRQVLEQIRVPSQLGGGVPLVALADISFGEGPASINRYDRQRQAGVEADLVGGVALSDALEAIKSLPVMKDLPAGVKFKETGDAELEHELFEEFGTAMRLGLMLVYIVLAILFASLLHPLTILFSLPLSITGAIMAVLIASLPLNLPVIIGILMLMGIVTKNAIMLIDFAIESMHAGMDRTAAIVDACQKRARPIIMTTIAMVAGMLPSAFAVGAGGEFRAPMAISVIGGLVVSTLLSLLFVPAFFTIMDDFGRLTWRIFGPLVGKADEPPPSQAGASRP
jgi:hydrophobe/amphiphile efflux-1 (HAE1) family protein